MGVRRGDRVCAYLPNRPETAAVFLACASIGAIWSICSPDMGPVAVLDRFRQIEPTVLIACDGYRYGGVAHDRAARWWREIGRAVAQRGACGAGNRCWAQALRRCGQSASRRMI